MKKYELTGETKIWCGHTMHRIRAVAAFGNVKAGELGGYVEKEGNLSQDGDAWVYGNARVCGNAQVSGNARLSGNAEVSGDAWIYRNAWIYDNAQVYGNARVCGNAQVYGNARVCGAAEVYGAAQVCSPLHLLVIGPCGSRNEFTTFFRNRNREISVRCGCFHGNIEEFLSRVSETHGDNKHALVYRAAAEAAKVHIDLTEEGNSQQ